LGVFIGALQLLLDRGPIKDWFDSGEIRLEALVSSLALYLFIVHTLTAERPFIRLAMYRDRNFLTGNVMIFVVGIVLFATLALLPPLLQGLLGYTAFQAGIVTAPRGTGTLIAMLFVGRLMGRVDVRLVIASGFALTAISLWQMSHFSLQVDMAPLIWSGAIQGLGTGIVYVPMAALSFATLPALMRNEGTALFNLVRNLGSSIGISTVQALLVRNTQLVHASLSAHLTPFAMAMHGFPAVPGLRSMAALNAQVTAQAAMVAYLDDFYFMLVLTVLVIPLLLLVRTARAPVGAKDVVLD
ncbi:MAG TPA: MFS transporter, partial [Steroidobacteraceae bacterium]|nr:MFS transporter [Steroidobacteraceae bacterium]